jgi:hypothetical protein
VGGGLHGVQVEQRVGQRLDGGQHDGEVLGTAAGHHRVDRELLHRRLALAGGQDADDLQGIPAGGAQHLAHARLGGRHDRQPVGPAALLVEAVGVLPGAVELEDGGGRPPPAHGCVTALRTASRARSAFFTTSPSWMPPRG